jgi:predicted MFS family arabinose efflux permease
LIGCGVASTLVLLTLPVFVGGIVAAAGWGDLERGLIAAADMAGSAIASLAVLGRLARFDWRRAARIGLLVAAGGNIACLLAESFAALLALRLLCGLGCGVVLSISFTGLCHAPDPARQFGFYVLAQLLLQAMLLACLPAVIAAAGMRGVYLLFAASLAGAVLLTAHLPLGPRAAGAADTLAGAPAYGDAAWIALAGQAVYFLAMAALWTYYEGIGSASALGMDRIGDALAASAIAGLGGAAAAVLLGARARPSPSLAAGTLLSVAAALMLVGGTDALGFTVSACLFNFAWNYTFPYQMGVLARFDRAGSVAVTSLLVQLGGLALGPALAAALLVRASYDTMLVVCATAFALGLALFLRSARA